ncbi:spore germination protein [Metabacillus sediminilitoris]|uniref:Spore germination protein n=1 Tax=Metabacillus sediminilitoris TaxID=2567941 RepID=A0A4S4BHE8_9BACI|nr:hypothetical protein GMB29_11495 [Metabacillus sediminilitoris]THF73976.1 spore germination protein [Metabacillus sediminilitoris]
MQGLAGENVLSEVRSKLGKIEANGVIDSAYIVIPGVMVGFLLRRIFFKIYLLKNKNV